MNDNFPEREREKEEDEYTEFRKEPTFEEYVDYLLNTDVDSYDEHWKPISRLCHVCEFNFDYIIKYENFKEEINYFVEMLKESGRLPTKFHLQWKNRGGTDRETTTKYLSQVSQHKRWLLYEKYYEDFLYFGYTLEDHVRL
nr:carbohydrate sulfotransferase 11-like [Cherax quadricarinatus]